MLRKFLTQISRSKPPAPLPVTSPTPALPVRLILRFQRFIWDVAGVLTLAGGLITLLALFGLTQGSFVGWWLGILRFGFGWGSWLLPPTLLAAGWHMLRRGMDETSSLRWGRVLFLEIAAFSLLALFALLGKNSIPRAEAGLDGGLIGWGLADVLSRAIPIPRLLIGLLAFLCLLTALIGSGLLRLLVILMRRVLEGWVDHSERAMLLEPPSPQSTPLEGAPLPMVTVQAVNRKIPLLPPEFRKRFRIARKEGGGTPPPPRDERLPPLDLLGSEQSLRPDERNINQNAGLIEKTLAEFGIPAKVVGFRIGPTVTQFAVEPGFIEKPGNGGETAHQKVRVSQISALSRDLALALSAERLRIEAPVPGRPYVGIEVPNPRASVVRLRPILESEGFSQSGSPLTLALGRDVSGQPVVADLAKMPHLLIAGTTGSGKSVCIAALTACLVLNNSPEDLRLVMIDPKMVELVRFNGLPHLYGRVETGLERILGVLRWTVMEMDRRYKILEASRARNIDSYNRKIRRRKGETPLPQIVVMIDELADLMMSAPDQTEHTLVRLAQMARATGIHLIVATQRPSTDIVTGLIKANFPARLAFATASSVDSRVILDTAGAETLLGRGDMLFLPPEIGHPLRAQGVMVTDSEIEKVITFWQQAHTQAGSEPPPWEELFAREAELAEKDNLIEKAIAIVQQEQRANASLLQRRLKIGYPRAARLLDELEDLGVIGKLEGAKEREVLARPEG